MYWERRERAVNKGGALATKGIWLAAGLMMLVGVVFLAVNWMLEPVQVAREEFGARATLKRYEWFKDAAAQIAARDASLKVFESRFAALKKAYGETPRAEWARADQEQGNLWEQEITGLIAARNSLADEYNAAMVKEHHKIFNLGAMPKDGKVLPREYVLYAQE